VYCIFKFVDALPGERVPLLEMDAAYGQVRQPFLASMFCLLLTHLHQNLAGQALNKLLDQSQSI
jgi:hypothetical protein